MVKRLCVSSAVEVAVSPDALSLMPGLFSSAQPSLFVSKPYFFSPCPSFQLLSHFIFYYPIMHYHTASGSLSLGSLFTIFFSWLCLPEGGNSIFPYPAGIAPPTGLFLRLFLCCHCARIMLMLSKDPIDLTRHEKVVYSQCLWFPEVRACGETRAAAFLDILVLLSGTSERQEHKYWTKYKYALFP